MARLEANYAKRNYDNSRLFDIDDVPSTGPPKIHQIPHDILVDHATKIANMLMNDDNLVICRKTGMMMPKKKATGRVPTSMVTRPSDTTHNHHYCNHDDRETTHAYRYDNREHTRYETPQTGQGTEWDTDMDSMSDGEYDNKEFSDFRHVHDIAYDRHNDGRRREPVHVHRHEKPHCHQSNRPREGRNTRYVAESVNKKGRQPKIDYYSESKDEYTTKNVRSGISAWPSSNVCDQLRYLHFSFDQISGFIGQNIGFHQLTYEQFMAGELVTIVNCQDEQEKYGRTQLLNRISLWKLRANVTWLQVCNAYAHVIRRVANCEIDWTANRDNFERHIYDKIALSTSKIDKSKKPEITWFCKAFQRPEGCPKDSPHSAKTGNSFKQVSHICATCWQKEKVKKSHAETSTDSPHREA